MKTIVIVDDFENTRKVVEYTLKTVEHESLMAENGEEALKHFDGRNIDLLITDLNMPIMDGVELVKRVRQMDKYKFIPILMLTTERNPDKMKQADEVKVTSWVQKPFDFERFLKIVKKCLK